MKTNVKVSLLTPLALLFNDVVKGIDLPHLNTTGGGKLKSILLALLLLAGWSNEAFAQANKLPETSTAAAPKYYVIQNCETNKYMQYNGHGTFGYMKLADSVSGDAFLWYFEGTSAQDGCKIVTKAGAAEGDNYKYLTDGTYSLSRIGKYSSSGTTFYIHRNPADMVGCVVSTTSGTPVSGMANCWEEYGANEVALSSLGGGEDFKWIFKSYEDLLEEAAANGVNISPMVNSDPTDASNFDDLIDAINTAKSAKQVQSPGNGNYLLRNRRYGYYLNSNGTAMYGTSTATDYSLWQFQIIGGTAVLVNAAKNVSIRLNTGASDNKYYSLDTSVNQAFNATVIASSDGDRRFVAFQGVAIGRNTYYMAMVSDATVEGREGQSFSSDWEFIEAVEGENYDHVILSEDELLSENYATNGAWFFRIRNVGRDVKNYAEDQFDGGGWLEDVDHTHAQYRKSETSSTAAMWVQEEAELMYTAKDAEIYAAIPDRTHASALWEFILLGRGSSAGENATGLISPEHNIFALRNANTGKYICNAAVANGSFADVVLTESLSSAAAFYLTQLVDGQYALNVYSGTSGSGTDSNIGAIRVTETTEGYHGGLTFHTDAASVNSNSAWLILPAPTLDLNIMTTSTTDDPYEWSTFYYPFDVKSATVASGREIDFFAAEWSTDVQYDPQYRAGAVIMHEVEDVPGGQAVIVRSNMNGDDSFGKMTLNVYSANSGQLTSTESDFADNAWKGVVESEGHYFGDSWKDYWILNRNRNGELKLLHPAGNYLLPNRAYIDNESYQSHTNNAGVRLSSIAMIIPERTEIEEPTGLTQVPVNAQPVNAIYNMSGQRMNATTLEELPKGLYILNGKKILVK